MATFHEVSLSQYNVSIACVCMFLQDSTTGQEVIHELVVYKTDYGHYELLIKMDIEGHYVGWVKYQGVKIGPPKFTIISLSGDC